MHLADLNWLAVIVSAVAFYALGALWYSVLFGKAWAAELGIDMENPPEVNMVKTMGGTFVLELVAAIVVGMLMAEMGATGHLVGIHTGLLLGLGIASVMMGVNYLHEQKSLKLWLINAAHITIGLALVGAIQGAWQ